MRDINKDIFSVVMNSFAIALGIDVEKIDANQNFSKYSNLDSMGFVKLIISLNKQFNVELDTEIILNCNNIIQISQYIEKLKK